MAKKKTKKVKLVSKYRKGDKVMVLKDMTKYFTVDTTYIKSIENFSSHSMFFFYAGDQPTEKIVIVSEDGKTYEESELSFYSEPLHLLAKSLENVHERIDRMLIEERVNRPKQKGFWSFLKKK